MLTAMGDVMRQAYQKGWRAGTRQYCQPNTGFNIGAQGGSFNNICPTDQVGAFLETRAQDFQIFSKKSEKLRIALKCTACCADCYLWSPYVHAHVHMDAQLP